MLFSARFFYLRNQLRRAVIFAALFSFCTVSCGDSLFLSYQIRKNDFPVLSENSKTIGGVTVSAVPDDYTVMQASYAAFLISINNGSKNAVTIELNRIELTYKGKTSLRIRPKKKYESFAVEPGEQCDVRIAYELPFETVNIRGLIWSNTLSVPVVFSANGKSGKTEYFSFTSSQSGADPLIK